MSINLVKGSSIDLRKTTDNESVLSKVTIGLGWDPSSHSQSFDLDASALLLQGGKLVSDDDIVYYRKQQHKSGLVYSSGDNLTGAGDGDDEQIIAKLSSLDSKYDKIIIFVTIYSGESKRQDFSMIKSAFSRIMDNNGKELVRHNISKDDNLSGKCSYEFVELNRKGDTWEVNVLDKAHSTSSITDVANLYK